MSLTKKQREVIRKILYAVETGGQVYGKQRYDDFTEAYTNSSAEHSITMGAGAWYATEAKKLLELIRDSNSAKFKSLDTAGIDNDLKTQNWSTYKLSKTSAKAKCIVKIISSDLGIKCQDELMESQIITYAKHITTTYGDMSADAIAECINIRHQGGDGALKRILAKTKKPYTAKTIYDALCTDPSDKSNNNQVGDYVTRQKKVYEMITKYLKEEEETSMTEYEIRQKVVDIAKSYINCKESNGTHKQIIDLYNSVKPLPRGYKVQYNDAWCATTVSAIGIKANLSDIILRECGCGAMIQLYQKVGRWVENDAHVPEIADIVMYDWDDNGKGDCTGYPEHVGIIVEVNKTAKTFKVFEGNMNNACGYRTLSFNGKNIRGFCCPDYKSKATKEGNSSTANTPSATPSTPSTPSTNAVLNNKAKWQGVVTADELNVRTWAGVENSKCSFSPLKEGTEVSVCDSIKAKDNSTWYYIKYKEKYGFVSSKYISKIVTEQSNTDKGVEYASSFSSSLGGTYKTTNDLYLRKGAGNSKKDICIMPKGAKVKCYGYYTTVGGTKWYLVEYKTHTGYCSSAYLKKA